MRENVMGKKQQLSLKEVLSFYDGHIEFSRNKPVHANSRGTYDTILHVAALLGNAHHVRVLIENGADVNAIGDIGFTPLHSALLGKNERVIEILVAAGARIDIKDEYGSSPLDQAKKGGLKSIVKIMKAGRLPIRTASPSSLPRPHTRTASRKAEED